MALDFTRITASVQAMTDVDTGVIALLTDLAQKLRDALAMNDPAATAALESLANQIDAQKQALADAITANTPAA